jgi:cytochrome d ubiquinol oxidase subunit I
MTFSGWAGVLAGWYTTEIGRQPFLVTGVLRTADAVTNVSAGNIGLTLALYLLLYAVLITAYVTVVFYLARQAGQADSKTAEPTAHGPRALAGKAATEGGHA